MWRSCWSSSTASHCSSRRPSTTIPDSSLLETRCCVCVSVCLCACVSVVLRLFSVALCLSDVVLCGVVWCCVMYVVWCGVVRCGVVWCGVVWCGVLRWGGNTRTTLPQAFEEIVNDTSIFKLELTTRCLEDHFSKHTNTSTSTTITISKSQKQHYPTSKQQQHHITPTHQQQYSNNINNNTATTPTTIQQQHQQQHSNNINTNRGTGIRAIQPESKCPELLANYCDMLLRRTPISKRCVAVAALWIL